MKLDKSFVLFHNYYHMSSKSEIKNIRLIESKPYLTKAELALLLEKKERNLDKKIIQLIRDEILIPLKKGLYLSRIFYLKNKNDIEEYLSNIIFYPSYISLEYVLAKEGLIPESVFSYTCVTLKTTRQFSNKLGRFTYRKIKEKLFTGYIQKSYYDDYKIKIATKSKALFDYLYYKPIKKLEEIDDLRVNWQNLSKVDLMELARYIDLSASKKMIKIYKYIRKKYDNK
ncbi:MAG: hypothetical protein UR68_C0021G0007 [Candidatus Roizmanbacteria bacterium GW2011_GWA2_35_19]|uniref:AbiEi antitoxin C-terminal domain-containing protein n=2 Tax=Candidatus Roizmaniibacteriota TaxID=1752723 RepID=A0A0G0E9Q6_9BACT|nr:MAG: hypothetical protein UR63_C0029G0010 [Candidatus Roizmanbacteria bacterium GW2011_GWC2_35_12]KKP72075.1 MAG: hypothetical protein UR68_C0021G0007 [Candidatus Roizmanbacteria bacterium GW2011_GWA2_35_19]